VATIWLIPVARDLLGWQWAFALLALGPVLGIVAMLRLQPIGRAPGSGDLSSRRSGRCRATSAVTRRLAGLSSS
jgi:predicted MFS family arabinose efflux permease